MFAQRSSARPSAPAARPASYARRTRGPSASQSPERRTQRTTRSQSRELGDNVPTQSSRRAGGTRARQAATETNNSSVGSERGATHRNLARSEQANGLSPVIERRGDVQYPNLSPQDELRTSAGNGHAEARENMARQSGAFSNISGTTAVAVDSNEEETEFDVDDIIQALPDISSAADKLLSYLSSSTGPDMDITSLAKELTIPGSKTSKAFKRLLENFKYLRKDCGNGDYIDRNKVLQAMYKVASPQQLPTRNSRPDVILQKANLTTFASLILVPGQQIPNTHRTLEFLDESFPNLFMSKFSANHDLTSAGSSVYQEETFDLALDLRTQLAISFFHAEPETAPLDIIRRCFQDTQGQVRSRPPPIDVLLRGEYIRGWSFEGFGNGRRDALPSHNKLAVADRIRDIIAFFYKDDSTGSATTAVHLEPLENAFPWLEFISNLVEWAQQRRREINDQISGRGGVERITKLLERDAETDWSTLESDRARTEQSGREEKAAFEIQRVHEAASASRPQAVPNSRDLQRMFGTRQAASHLRQRETARRESARRSNPHSLNTSNIPAGSHSSRAGARSRSDVVNLLSRTEPDTTEAIPAPSSAPPKTHRSQAAPESPTEDEWRPQNMDDDEIQIEENPEPGLEPASSVNDVMQRLIRQQKEKNKENLQEDEPDGEIRSRKRFFNETQDVRDRVDPISEGEEEPSGRAGPSSGNPRKRARIADDAGDDSDVSMDRGFEIDQRAVDPGRRQTAPVNPRLNPFAAAAAEEPTQRSSAGRQSGEPLMSGGRDESAARQTSQQSDTRRPSVRENGHGSHQGIAQGHQQDNDAVPDFDFSQVNQTAKRNVAQKQPRKKQVRRPWTEEACKRLMELVENDEFSTSWSKIAALGDPLFEGRDQVALKDKARNMSMDFLKARVQLPHNFELVTLKNSDKAILRGMGAEVPGEERRAEGQQAQAS